jgi:hypothetical protein
MFEFELLTARDWAVIVAMGVLLAAVLGSGVYWLVQ